VQSHDVCECHVLLIARFMILMLHTAFYDCDRCCDVFLVVAKLHTASKVSREAEEASGTRGLRLQNSENHCPKIGFKSDFCGTVEQI